MDLAKLVARESLDALRGFLQGEAKDLGEWAEVLAADAVRAAQHGRVDILSEIREQAKVIAEIKRIRTVGFAWEHVAKIVIAVAKAAVQAAEMKGWIK
jgi:hypothetical protein